MRKRFLLVAAICAVLVSAILVIGCDNTVQITYGVRVGDYDAAKGTVVVSDAADNPKTVFNENDTVQISATPKTGYKLATFKINGETVATDNGVYTFSIRSAVTVTVEFVSESTPAPAPSVPTPTPDVPTPPTPDTPETPVIYTVTADYDTQYGNVTVTDADSAENSMFEKDATVQVRVTPAAGYAVSSFTVNDANQTLQNGVYSFTATENVTIHVTFAFDATAALTHALQAATDAASYTVTVTTPAFDDPYRIYVTPSVIYEESYGEGFLLRNDRVYGYNALDNCLTRYFATPRTMADCRAAFADVSTQAFTYTDAKYVCSDSEAVHAALLLLLEKNELWQFEDYLTPTTITVTLTQDFLLDTVSVACQDDGTLLYTYSHFNATQLPADIDVSNPSSVLDRFAGVYTCADGTVTELTIDVTDGIQINDMAYDVMLQEHNDFGLCPTVTFNGETYYLVKTTSVLFLTEDDAELSDAAYTFQPSAQP